MKNKIILIILILSMITLIFSGCDGGNFVTPTNTYTITASAGPHGSISPSGNVTVNQGSDKSFTIIPVIGYSIDDVLVDGSSVGAVSSYTFTNVTKDHTISATFIPAPTVQTISIVTDSSWKSMDSEVEGWTSVNFDDSWWEDVEEANHEEAGVAWTAIFYPKTPKPHTSYFRKNFEIEGTEIISGRIYPVCYAYNSGPDNYIYIYVNDNYIGLVRGEWGWIYSGQIKEFNIAPYLNPGKNVIAIKADFNGTPGEDYWWALTGTIRYSTTPISTNWSAEKPLMLPLESLLRYH